MQLTDDSALLRQFAEDHSDEAFAALVQRHVNLVYSVGLRQTGSPHAAEEITQAVFIILAKKAAQLRHDKALASWLFQTTRLTASNFIRSESRRHRREEEAYMQSILNEAGTEVWPRIAPLLDDAVAGLREKDRRAIVLRYYEGRNLREVGLALGASEAAAEKRVSRAVEKLRKFFTKRGVDSTAATIAETISANSITVAPAALAKITTAAALAKGATASTSTLTLIKGALKIMAWTKMKTAIVIVATVIVATSTTTVIVKEIRSPSVDESLWSVNSDNIAKAPPVLIIRPARYPNRVGLVGDGNKVIGLNMPISALFTRAYASGFGAARMILPPSVASRHYDLILTLPSHATESLREKLKTQLGLVARREIVETNVLCLEVKNTARLDSCISKGGSP